MVYGLVGCRYTFKVTGSKSGVADGWGEVTITTHGPPKQGTCAVAAVASSTTNEYHSSFVWLHVHVHVVPVWLPPALWAANANANAKHVLALRR